MSLRNCEGICLYKIVKRYVSTKLLNRSR